MSDDEEIVLADSELYKYMKSNYDANDFQDIYEVVNSDSVYTNSVRDFKSKQNDSISITVSKKFSLPENCNNIIHVILKTGLLYPDHIMDLENHLNISSDQEQHNIKARTAIYSTGLIFSSSLTLQKNFKFLQCVGFMAATFCSYKLYALVKLHYETSKMKCFATAIENFFSINKQVLSFILESEFILRSKIIRDQQVYIPSNGWIQLNTTDGLKNSGLLVPELRNVLMAVYIDVICVFLNFLKYMHRNLVINSTIGDSIELPEEFYKFQRQAELIPSSEDLKKLSTVYLLIQSECLKCIIFSVVDDIWTSKTSWKDINTEITMCMNCFVTRTKRLRSLYLKCMNEIKTKSSIKANSFLQIGNTNSKLYMFIKTFLTKADAHVLSLFLDLKMVNDWVNEFEENNKDNNSDVNKKLVIMLQDRLQQLKTNLESFNNLYNDNCNLLRSIADENSSVSCHDSRDIEEKLNERVTITGIKVGKSDFECSGEDEVLISLSNCDSNNWTETGIIDYEEEVLKQSLPKSVLDELKCALKSKKEEWIEREKRATCNQNVSIDSLDFDNLLTSSHMLLHQDGKDDGAPKEFEGILGTSRTTCLQMDNGINPIIQSNNHLLNDQLNVSVSDDSLYYSFNTNYSNNLSANTSNSSDDTLISNCVAPIRPGNFADQIKLVQRSFNLNTTEEFLGDSSGDEEN